MIEINPLLQGFNELFFSLSHRIIKYWQREQYVPVAVRGGAGEGLLVRS